MSIESYTIQKQLVTNTDFDRMSWHDVRIHAFAFGPADFELSFDIDYIYQWLNPRAEESHYRFWIGSATLVFENVYSPTFEISSSDGLTVSEIRRSDGKPSRISNALTDWCWTIDCLEGDIRLRSTGFRQFARAPAVLSSHQSQSVAARGGYSFECPQR